MEQWTCKLCGEDITDDELDDNCIDTDAGTFHETCLDEWQRDADRRAADFWYDYRYDR